MGVATQTFAANGTNWGSGYRTSGPSYSKILASSGSGARSSFFGGSDTWRAMWEVDMAALVTGGYVYGQTITAASLSMTVTARSGGNVKPGLVAATLADSAATVFAALDATNCQGASDAFSGTGAKVLTLDSAVISAIQSLGATEKKLLALPLASEGGGGQMITDPTVACVLTLTFDDPVTGPIAGSAMLLGVGR